MVKKNRKTIVCIHMPGGNVTSDTGFLSLEDEYDVRRLALPYHLYDTGMLTYDSIIDAIDSQAQKLGIQSAVVLLSSMSTALASGLSKKDWVESFIFYVPAWRTVLRLHYRILLPLGHLLLPLPFKKIEKSHVNWNALRLDDMKETLPYIRRDIGFRKFFAFERLLFFHDVTINKPGYGILARDDDIVDNEKVMRLFNREQIPFVRLPGVHPRDGRLLEGAIDSIRHFLSKKHD